MNTLALLYAHDARGIVITALLVGIALWLIFYILPLPQPVRTILAVVVAVLLILWLIPGCAGSGEGGQWTPADTTATVNAIGQTYDTGSRIYRDINSGYRPAPTVITPAVPVAPLAPYPAVYPIHP